MSKCPHCKKEVSHRSTVMMHEGAAWHYTCWQKIDDPINKIDAKIKNLIAALADLGADVESRILGVQVGDKLVHMSLTHTLNGMGEMLAAKDKRIAELEAACTKTH